MNALSMAPIVAAEPDIAWEKSPAASVTIATMLAVSEAHDALDGADVTQRAAQSVLGRLETRLVRLTHGSNSHTLQTHCNGGIVGELWMTLEQIRGEFLVMQVPGRRLNSRSQMEAYALLDEAALTVEAAVLAAAGGAS